MCGLMIVFYANLTANMGYLQSIVKTHPMVIMISESLICVKRPLSLHSQLSNEETIQLEGKLW